MKFIEMEVVEIKVDEQGRLWEETPVAVALKVRDSFEADALCDNIAKTIKKQVRWNWVDSPQGHYNLP